MMREAQKMMADPAFQERMKQYTENEAFKASLAKTQEMLKDEAKVKELEETMKKRVEEGTKELEALRKELAEAEEGEKKKEEELKVGKPNKKLMRTDAFAHDLMSSHSHTKTHFSLQIFSPAKE